MILFFFQEPGRKQKSDKVRQRISHKSQSKGNMEKTRKKFNNSFQSGEKQANNRAFAKLDCIFFTLFFLNYYNKQMKNLIIQYFYSQFFI